MATKITKAGSNLITPAIAKLAADLANAFVNERDMWPGAFKRLVDMAMKGEVSLVDANANIKGEKTIDDDVSRMVTEMQKDVANINRPGVRLKKETAEGKRSDLRVAVNLGLLKKDHPTIDGAMILADAIDVHKEAGTNAKEMFPTLVAVGREQIKAVKEGNGRLTRDQIKPLVTKKPKDESDAADVFLRAASAIAGLYAGIKEGATGVQIRDNFPGRETRAKLALVIASAAKEIVSHRDIAKKAEALAKEREEAPKSTLGESLAAFGKEMAATAAKKPTKRGK